MVHRSSLHSLPNTRAGSDALYLHLLPRTIIPSHRTSLYIYKHPNKYTQLIQYYNARDYFTPLSHHHTSTIQQNHQNVLQSRRTLLRLQMRLLPTLNRPLLRLRPTRPLRPGKNRASRVCLSAPFCARRVLIAGFRVFELQGLVSVERRVVGLNRVVCGADCGILVDYDCL